MLLLSNLLGSAHGIALHKQTQQLETCCTVRELNGNLQPPRLYLQSPSTNVRLFIP